MPEILFKEVQRHNQLLLKIIIILTAIFPVFYLGWIFVPDVVIPLIDRQLPKDLESNLISIFCILFFCGGIILFSIIAKLETFIDEFGLKVRYYPFMIKFKEILVSEIESFRIRKYSPIREFGGWGVRIALNGKRAYNAAGNIGIQLMLKSGSAILIGTGKPDEFSEALDVLFRRYNKVNKFSK